MTAFGPSGPGGGDNPQLATQAIAGNPVAAWYSQWYGTARFAHLKTGTGLLVDMGRTVSVSWVRVWMTARSGAGLQLRAGTRPASTGSPSKASP